jgi:ABC-type nitrate/sulfonate/bicarbonate transport system permease component
LDKTTTLPLSAAGQPEAHDPKRDFEAKPEKAVNRTERRGMAVVRARESRSASIMQSLALPVLVLLLWEIAGRAGFIMSGILPYPSLVAQGWWTWAFGENAMGLNAYSGTWAENAFNSFERVAKGYLVAIVVAVPIGIIIGWSRMAARLIDPTIQSMRPIPITAWLPFSIALFGIRDFGAIFLIALGAFYPIVVNTTHGARDVNSNLIRAAAMMGANRWQMLFRVVFPKRPARHLYRHADRSRHCLDGGDRGGDGRGQVGPRLRALGCLLCRPDGHRHRRHGLHRAPGLHHGLADRPASELLPQVETAALGAS